MILHSLDPPLFYLKGGDSEKFKNGGGGMVQGQVFLKGGGGGAGLFHI